MGLVINFPQDYLASELAALMINLSYNTRNVEQMIANKGLNLLMDRLAVIIIMFIMLIGNGDNDDNDDDDNDGSYDVYYAE
jgi:hypothetical protein